MDNEDARVAWQDVIMGEGGHCPVCDRWGRIYKRNINATMAKSLLWLAGMHQNIDEPIEWVDVPTKAPRWLVRSNQLPSLKWWGLVARKPVEKDSKTKHSGFWKITDLGHEFALGGKWIPKAVYTYNDTVQFVSPEHLQISDCFKEYFDYKEVMGNYFPLKAIHDR